MADSDIRERTARLEGVLSRPCTKMFCRTLLKKAEIAGQFQLPLGSGIFKQTLIEIFPADFA